MNEPLKYEAEATHRHMAQIVANSNVDFMRLLNKKPKRIPKPLDILLDEENGNV